MTNALARRVKRRENAAMKNSKLRAYLDHALDVALQGTFPASDPIAIDVLMPTLEKKKPARKKRAQKKKARARKSPATRARKKKRRSLRRR
jgi:hypothetical protein